jgi:hypothetical protein
MTLQSLDAIETAAHLARTRQASFARRGGLIFLAAGAPLSSGEVRRRQKEQVKRFVADDALFLSIVVEGEGVYPDLQRTSVRTMLTAARRRIFEDLAEATKWLLGEVGDPKQARQLVEYVRSLRA